MSEEWKDIEGYEGVYMVSNWGNVKSLERLDSLGHLRKERILKPRNNKGYLFVILCKDGKSKHHYIHRLVAEAFLPNPDNLPQINHIREFEKTNNRVENLEWCDRKYNCNYGSRNQRIADKLVNGKWSKKVNQYTIDGEFIKKWSSMAEVKRQLGYAQGNICKCCNGQRKTAYGYIWRYRQ